MYEILLRFILAIIENIALIVLLFRLFRIKYEKITRLAIFVLLTSLLTTFSFYNLIPEVRILFNSIIHIVLVWSILRFSLKFSLVLTVIRVFFQFIAEILILITIFNVVDDFLNLHNLMISAITTAVLVIEVAVIYISKISLYKLNSIYSSKVNKLFFYLFLAFLIIFSLLVFTLTVLSNEHILVFVKLAIIISLVLFFITLYLVNKLIIEFEDLTIQKMESEYTNKLEDVFYAMNSHRHDYINHLYVLKKMITKDRTEQLKSYIDDLLEESTIIEMDIPIINNSPLAAILLTKIQESKSKKIDFKVDTIKNIPQLKIKDRDLVKIVANIIDNAFDEEQKYEENKRKVTVTVSSLLESFLVIKINNRNSFISSKEKTKLFLKGYSSKGINRGNGLAIVQEVLSNCRGQIELESNEHGTSFTIFIPCRKNRE